MQFRLVRHDVVDSTSERAFASIEAGEALHGDVHLATAQTRGRGRLGRTWVSAPGEGLYLSAILLPGPPPLLPTALTMAGGLAVVDAVRALGVRDARLDWPNDVVTEGGKLCGILVESRGLRVTDPHYVVGIGLNVAQREFPADLTRERAVASLALAGIDCPVDRAAAAVLAALGERLERVRSAPEELARDYLEATHCAGRRVRIETGAGVREGTLVELTLANGLRLELGDGSREDFRLEHVRALDPIGTLR